MKKLTLLLVVILVVALTTSVYSQRYAIIKPTKSGVVSDAIPITKKDAQDQKKLEKIINTHHSSYTSATGIVDTLFQDLSGVNFGWSPNDSAAFYFDPGAACYIKAVAFYTKSWNDLFGSGYNLFIKKTNWTVDNTPADSIDGDGWAGYWDDGGNWVGSSWGFPPFGEMMWGDFPVTATVDAWNWTEMIYLGVEPDTEGEPFMVGFTPFGEAGSYIGFLAGDAGGNHHMIIKRMVQVVMMDGMCDIMESRLTW